jgi:hypothetical protein
MIIEEDFEVLVFTHASHNHSADSKVNISSALLIVSENPNQNVLSHRFIVVSKAFGHYLPYLPGFKTFKT